MNGNPARRPRALLAFVPSEGAALGLAALAVLLLWFSLPALKTLHAVWVEDIDYSHGYLVLALMAWLLVLEVRRAPLTPFQPSWLGMACLFALLLATIAGLASTTQLVAQVALPALWIAAVWAAAGASNARRFALPLAYLYVAIPVWTVFMEPLRRLTVFVVTMWIRAANLPAYIDGNLIHVPSGTFEVRGGCAGLRYAVVAVALAILSNLLNRRRWAPSMLLISLALLPAFVGNWLRVFITVAVGQSDAQNLFTIIVHEHHTFFGWVLFVIFMIPLFYFDRMVPAGDTEAPAPAPTLHLGAVSGRRLYGACAACALLALGIWLNHRVSIGGDVPPGAVALVSPEIPGWQRVEPWEDSRAPQYAGAKAHVASWYADGAARVGAYVAQYPTQRQKEEVVFVGNRPEGQSAGVVGRRKMELTAASGITLPFEELEVTDYRAERRLVWVGLRVAGEPAGSVLAAKALQVVGAIRGRRDAQALVLTAACGEDCGNARAVLSRYAAAAAEPLYELAENQPAARFVRADAKDGAQ